ncbi:hypothetical protein HQ533_04020 [Candidatus Woesearchaeota archaeon]|nr:hypothetical protein [Candidatus Woesearchaeota archaeon]
MSVGDVIPRDNSSTLRPGLESMVFGDGITDGFEIRNKNEWRFLFKTAEEKITDYRKNRGVPLRKRYQDASNCIDAIIKNDGWSISTAFLDSLDNSLLAIITHVDKPHVRKLFRDEKLDRNMVGHLYHNIKSYRDRKFSECNNIAQPYISGTSKEVQDIKKVLVGRTTYVEQENDTRVYMRFWKNKFTYFNNVLDRLDVEDVSLHDLDDIKYMSSKIANNRYLAKKEEFKEERQNLLFRLANAYETGKRHLLKKGVEPKKEPAYKRILNRFTPNILSR